MRAWRGVAPGRRAARPRGESPGADRVRYVHFDEPDDRRHYFVLRLDGWKLDLSLFTHGSPTEVEEFQHELLSRLDEETRLATL